VIGGIQYRGYQISISEGFGIGADIEEEFLKTCEKWVI